MAHFRKKFALGEAGCFCPFHRLAHFLLRLAAKGVFHFNLLGGFPQRFIGLTQFLGRQPGSLERGVVFIPYRQQVDGAILFRKIVECESVDFFLVVDVWCSHKQQTAVIVDPTSLQRVGLIPGLEGYDMRFACPRNDQVLVHRQKKWRDPRELV